MERAFDRGRRRFARQPIVDGVHQHFDAKHIRQKYELLALVRALFAGPSEEIDGSEELVLRWLNFANEGMHVLHKSRYNFA
jgi:hypothetical protein